MQFFLREIQKPVDLLLQVSSFVSLGRHRQPGVASISTDFLSIQDPLLFRSVRHIGIITLQAISRIFWYGLIELAVLKV